MEHSSTQIIHQVAQLPGDSGVPGLPASSQSSQLQSGGIAVAVIMAVAFLINAVTSLVKAIK